MFTKQRQIDLHLPTSWNRCTTDELEAIAAAIIQEQQRVDRYHPFDWQRVKLGIVLSINEIAVNEELRIKNEEFASATENSDTEWLVRRPQDKKPWAISTGQLLALTDMLAWVDDEKADRLIFQFPYPTMQVDGSGKTVAYGEGGSKFFTLHSSLFTLQGPPPLLDGYTWREYRWLTDWMQEYMRLSNAGRDASAAQREFLAVLFKPAADATGAVAAVAGASDSGVNASLFTDFSPIKWQVILFWWSSLMGMLAKKFPRVFKRQPVGKRRPQKTDTPWDFYNCVTAMLADEYKSSEADQQNETYSVTLQKLENVAEKAAEMEKLKNK